MPTKPIGILFIILLFAFSAFAQDWEHLGVSSQFGAPMAYFLDKESVTRKGNEVTFKGMVALVVGEKTISPTHAFISEMRADCVTRKWFELSRKGKWNGQDLDEKFEKPEEQKPGTKDSMIEKALVIICTEKKVVRAD